MGEHPGDPSPEPADRSAPVDPVGGPVDGLGIVDPGIDPVAAELAAERGERRWPMALAVLFLIVLPFLLPQRLSARPVWVVPGIELAFLVTLIVGDPGRIDRRSAWLRRLSLALVGLLLVTAVGATLGLIDALITGSPELSSAGTMLATGGLVWVATNVSFAFLYWELDGGGPAARAHGMPRYPDLAFPEQLNPDLAPPGWRPVFVDYLYLGITNALAFSPTDVMPLAHWAKFAMAVQSLASLAILGLVVARAVNILQ